MCGVKRGGRIGQDKVELMPDDGEKPEEKKKTECLNGVVDCNFAWWIVTSNRSRVVTTHDLDLDNGYLGNGPTTFSVSSERQRYTVCNVESQVFTHNVTRLVRAGIEPRTAT